MLKPGYCIHFFGGVCCIRGIHGKMFRPPQPHQRSIIRLRKARVSPAAWGLLRRYIAKRLGWTTEYIAKTRRVRKIAFVKQGHDRYEYESQSDPLILSYSTEERRVLNRYGIKIIIWCLTAIFGTPFTKRQEGQCIILTPITKP